jgi:hypothetical protein
MSQLHEAAQTGGSARYPTNFQEGFAMEMRDVQNLRAAARMLALESHVKSHEGDSAGALRAIHTILRLARSLEFYPLVVAQLVRISIASHAYTLVADLSPHLNLSDEELVELTDELSKDDYDDGLYRSMLGERVGGLQAFEDPETLADDIEETEKLKAWSAKWLKRDRAFYLTQSRFMIAATKEPWPVKLDMEKQMLAELERIWHDDNPLTKLQYTYSFEVLPAGVAVFNATARAVSLRNATVAAIAVERYQMKTGNLPDTLEKLIPEFLESVPVDPFDGLSLRYRVDEGKFVVYSVGDNRQDDSGDKEGALDYVISVRRIEAVR